MDITLWNFPIASSCTKILSLKSFGNSSSNSYIKFLILLPSYWRKWNSAWAKNFLNHLENCWWEISESDLLLKECISGRFETQPSKDVPCTLQVVTNMLKHSLNMLSFARININSIRHKLETLAEQVKGNFEMLMI